VIRGAIIHLQGKLPVVADLAAPPARTDLGVVCTNLRTRDGKRPTFIDDQQGWFLIPMHEITIVELPRDAFDGADDAPIELGSGNGNPVRSLVPSGRNRASDEVDLAPLEPDEELLERIRQL
jgi:hypothetical protein